eukprot:12648194-Alexandrium_andersonii.AAC.1
MFENSNMFPTELIKAFLPKNYLVVTSTLGPGHFGYPVNRPRLLVCAINRNYYCWVGPPAADFEIFLRAVFGASPEMTGDIF